MQVNEHLECFSQRLLSVHSKGLPGNCSKVSQPALIGQSKGGFLQRCWARRGLHHLFVSLLSSSTDLTCLCVPSLPGIGVLDTTKKVTEECWVQDYDLLICPLLNSKLTAWGSDALWGVILKHRTIQIYQSPVFCKRWRIDNMLAQCSQGTQGTKAPKPKVQKVCVS